MNKWVVMMLGFVFVFGVAVVVIVISEKDDKEIAANISFLSGVRLTQHAQAICRDKISDAIGETAYSPTSTSGDRVSTVSLIWEGQSKRFKKIECTYNLD
ncbi:MAG: hypothetical protein ACRESZ_02880, partial [Methylococcales bacterium]